ncbi:MAG: hypothetical protein U0X20_26545 [Caldilineaceae bacterium]
MSMPQRGTNHGGRAPGRRALETDNSNERIVALFDGTVLERHLVEPEELALPGSTVMVAQLDNLKLKVYMPENRYGQISALGERYPVAVDSFPGETFYGSILG